jgi:hypothetical protein
MGTGRPGTADVDEYQALQLLDEGVVKRGVSDRKLRSFPETPGPLLTPETKTHCDEAAGSGVWQQD